MNVFFEQETSYTIELDADGMTDDAQEEAHIQNDNSNDKNIDDDANLNLVCHVGFVDKVGTDNTQASAA